MNIPKIGRDGGWRRMCRGWVSGLVSGRRRNRGGSVLQRNDFGFIFPCFFGRRMSVFLVGSKFFLGQKAFCAIFQGAWMRRASGKSNPPP